MNAIRRDELLQEMLQLDGRDIVKFRKLTENEKNVLSKDMVESMFAQITNKYNHTDFDVIEHSRGNIERISGYDNIQNSIQALKELKNRTVNTQMRELDIVEQALKNVKDYTKQWEMGFKLNKSLVIMLYNSVVSATVCSLTYLISTSLEYIKDLDGSFDVKLKEQNDKSFSYPTVFIKNLENFNKVALNGELAKFFEVSYSKQGFAIATTTTIAGISAVTAIGVSLAIVPLIREIIYQFYFMRVSIAEHLKVQASYLEMNQSRLTVLKGTKNTAKKQEKIANELIKIADKIDVDQKTATKKAEIEIKKENKNNNINDVAIDSSVASSYGGIL